MNEKKPDRERGEGPVIFLTISNGAGHIRGAEAIAETMKTLDADVTTMVIDVADFMTQTTRLTHITLYLWLVKYFPALWELIDRYQKKQTQTSPDWYYRRGCRPLFELVRVMRPRALVATEVGCGEIAALIKRDLSLDCPLVAVDVDYDADRAWVQPEVDLYCAAAKSAREELIAHGARPEHVMDWGVPLIPEFTQVRSRERTRKAVCDWLELESAQSVLLIAGGSEGLGRIEAVTARLLRLERFKPQLIILTGRNSRLKTRCEKLAREAGALDRVRVLGWTERVPELMKASDLLVSKLGNTFDEAMASELPLIALEPPPGSERVQYRLLEMWGVGRAVSTLSEMTEAVTELLSSPSQLEAMRRAAHERQKTEAAESIARWLLNQTKMKLSVADDCQIEACAINES